jgi:hypothetical protein
MRLSPRGLDLIEALDCRPSLPLADHAHHGRAKFEQSRNVGLLDAICHHLSSRLHLLSGQFTRWMSLAAKVHQSGFPLKLCIARKRDPLKIARPVVRLYPVDVIYGKVASVSGDERPRDQPMNRMFLPLALGFNSYSQIAGFGDVRSVFPRALVREAFSTIANKIVFHSGSSNPTARGNFDIAISINPIYFGPAFHLYVSV